jgi:hypothetical protein
MKTPLFVRFLAILMTLCFGVLSAHAGSSGAAGVTVQYAPQTQGTALSLPSTSSYVLSVTPPVAYTNFPVTVNVRVVPLTVPVGDIATAASYIRLSSTSLTFTAPAQTIPVTVTMDFPLSALTPDIVSASYTYQIYTDGWATGFIDFGAGISAGLSLPSPVSTVPNPPIVNITTPPDGAQYLVAPNGFPAQIPMQYTAGTDSISPVITSISASLEGAQGTTPIVVTTNGLGTAAVTGDGTLAIPAPGSYSVSVTAINDVGSASDTNTFNVVVGAAPPTVSIQTPAPGTTYTYRLGSTPVTVPLSFTAVSNFGGVRTLTATLDGADVSSLFVPNGIGTLTATGSFSLQYTTAGTHAFVVTTTDDYGTATASTSYTINVIAPTPTINITTPTEGQVFSIPYGSASINVPYSFVTTSNNGFVVNSVSATLDGTAISPVTVGLGTPLATSTGTFANLTPGNYTLTANGNSAGIVVTTSVHFTVKALQPPPTVVINTPAPNATFTRYSNGPALSIPLTFTGTSNAFYGVITAITATLDGVPLTVTGSPVTLNQKVVGGSATMVVSTAGVHTIKVTATDYIGTATAVQTFTVTVLQGSTVSGAVFFDANTNGTLTAGEIGLASVPVALKSSTGATLATTTSAADGTYSFSQVFPGSYTVVATEPAGLDPTAGNSRSVTVGSANVTGVNIGYMIDFCSLQGQSAGGFTIGYWKNNVDKAISGKTSGIQVSAATIKAYTTTMGAFATTQYDGITMKQASAIMGSTSSAPVDLLSKQLVASEYNYINKAYLNGNQTTTYLFVWWGEYIVAHPSSFSSDYIIWAQKWFDAYNNTHGGAIVGPSLLGTTCTGSL